MRHNKRKKEIWIERRKQTNKQTKVTEKEGMDSRPSSDDTVFVTLKYAVLFGGMKPDTVRKFLENVNRKISLSCCNAKEP